MAAAAISAHQGNGDPSSARIVERSEFSAAGSSLAVDVSSTVGVVVGSGASGSMVKVNEPSAASPSIAESVVQWTV